MTGSDLAPLTAAVDTYCAAWSEPDPGQGMAMLRIVGLFGK